MQTRKEENRRRHAKPGAIGYKVCAALSMCMSSYADVCVKNERKKAIVEVKE